MRKVYIMYPAGHYAARLKTTNPLKARLYFAWLWLKHRRQIVVNTKFTNAY